LGAWRLGVGPAVRKSELRFRGEVAELPC
jgi:hypothetical protein